MITTFGSQSLNSGDDDVISNLYWAVEQKCRKYTKKIAIFILIFVQSAYILVFLSSIYYIYIGNFDTSTWPILYDLKGLFEANTIWGWYLLWFLTSSMDLSYTLSMSSTTTYFISCCIYIGAICDHFNVSMCSTQELVKRNRMEKDSEERELNQLKIREQMQTSIGIHSQIHE